MMKKILQSFLMLVVLTGCSNALLNLTQNKGSSGSVSSPPISQVVPTYQEIGAILPGFVWSTYAVGTSITVDFGQPANQPTSFRYSFYRNGVAIPGQAGETPKPEQVYTPVESDSGTILSCIVTPMNEQGSGDSVTIPGIFIN